MALMQTDLVPGHLKSQPHTINSYTFLTGAGNVRYDVRVEEEQRLSDDREESDRRNAVEAELQHLHGEQSQGEV